MKYGLFSSEKSYRRTELVKAAINKPEISEEEKSNLQYYHNLEKYINYGTRISILPMLYLLYKKKFFDKKSPLFKREIGLVIGGMLYIGASDNFASGLMWDNCEVIVRKYNQVMDKYYSDKKTFQEVRSQMKKTSENKLY